VTLCVGEAMATNLAIDDALLEEALRLGGRRSMRLV
jgi:hypothetical protein